MTVWKPCPDECEVTGYSHLRLLWTPLYALSPTVALSVWRSDEP